MKKRSKAVYVLFMYYVFYCLNPHVILKAINTFRISHKLAPHDSLTGYLKKLETDDTLDEIGATSTLQVLRVQENRRKLHWEKWKENGVHANCSC